MMNNMHITCYRNLLLLLAVNFLLSEIVEANFDPSRLFGNWNDARKSEAKAKQLQQSKDSGSQYDKKSSLVRELEDLEENISTQTISRISNNHAKSPIAGGSVDDEPIPSNQQPSNNEGPVSNKKVSPPRRPPPPIEPEEHENLHSTESVPEVLHGLVRTYSTTSGLTEQSHPRNIRPKIRYRSNDEEPDHVKSNLFSSNYLKKKIKGAIKSTKDSIVNIPKYVERASDAFSATMKLDKKGRILALIDELNKSMSVVRGDFSKFTEFWSPLMEQALNYVGATNLNKLKWNNGDEFDFRLDALYVIASGYEFMRIMIAWRQNTLIAHAAHRLYLETVKKDLSNPAIVVDENFMYQLEATHNYILFKSWLLLDNINLEPKLKFEYVSRKHDERVKNYESDYFRSIIVFQELYEPTMQEFEIERQRVLDSMSTAGAFVDEFTEVDEFIDDFIRSLDESPIQDIELSPELIKFMTQLKPEIQYNPQVYDKKFMLELKEAKEKAIRDLEQREPTEE